MKKDFFALLSILVLIISFHSCKKSDSNDDVKAQIIPPKWGFIPYDFFSHSSHFFEDRDGNIAYKNSQTLYLFNDKGVLQHTEPINLPNNESREFTFRRDGAFFGKMNAFNSKSSDFIFYHKKLDPFTYSRPTMIDIRKLDSLGKYIAEYYIHDIIPNKIANSSSVSCWVFASRYPDINSLFLNRDPQPVLIEMYDYNVGAEYELPKNLLPSKVNSSLTHFCFYTNQSSQTFSFDRFMKLVGTQQKNSLVPNINLLGSFVMKTTDGYYLSDDAIQLKNKIPGLSNDAKIFHCKDSLLHIYFDGNYSTINAITGAEVNKFDLKSEQMPIGIDTVNTFDYYRTKKGISYLVTSRGIVITN